MRYSSSPFLIVLSLLLFLATPGFRSEVQAETLPKKVAVLDLRARGSIVVSEAEILSDRIRTLLVRQAYYQVLERENMDRILKEQGFQTTQLCLEDDSCSIQLGRLLAVDEIITGSLSKLGGLHSISLRRIDVEKGTIVEDVFSDCYCGLEEVMLKRLPELVSDLSPRGARDVRTLPQEETEAQPEMPKKPAAFTASPATETPIRVIKPSLVYLEGAFPVYPSARWASITYQHQWGPYFALGIQGGLEGLTSTVNPFAGVTSRLYFNPHALAGFLELGGAIHGTQLVPVVSSELGLEYRDLSGWTYGGSVGAALGTGWAGRFLFTVEFLGGYAF